MRGDCIHEIASKPESVRELLRLENVRGIWVVEFSSWSPAFRIVILACPILIVLSGLVLSFYIACSRDFFVALSAIKSSPWLERQKNCTDFSSAHSRWMLVSNICGLLLLPGPHRRRGLLSIEELQAFPVRLKKMMLASTWLTIIGCVWIAIVAAIIKLENI